MVKLRLTRTGRKNRPLYRIVAADSRKPRDGKFLEVLGTYDPLPKFPKLSVKEERVYHWLKNGARPSDTVRTLMKRLGIMLKWDLMKKGTEPEKIDEAFKKWEALQAARMQRLSEKGKKKKVKKEAKKKAAPAAEPAPAAQ